MLSCSCGSLSLEQIHKARCTRIPIKFVLVGQKNFNVAYIGCCPAKVGLRFKDLKNFELVFSIRTCRKENVQSASFLKKIQPKT